MSEDLVEETESQVGQSSKIGLCAFCSLEEGTTTHPIISRQVLSSPDSFLYTTRSGLASTRDWFSPLPHIPHQEPNLCFGK
jgi:hypothetical protein